MIVDLGRSALLISSSSSSSSSRSVRSTRRSPSTRCAAGSRFPWSPTSTWRRSLMVPCWSAAGRSAPVTWSCPASWKWLHHLAPPLPLLPPPPPQCPTPPCLQGETITAATHQTTPGQVRQRNWVWVTDAFIGKWKYWSCAHWSKQTLDK